MYGRCCGSSSITLSKSPIDSAILFLQRHVRALVVSQGASWQCESLLATDWQRHSPLEQLHPSTRVRPRLGSSVLQLEQRRCKRLLEHGRDEGREPDGHGGHGLVKRSRLLQAGMLDQSQATPPAGRSSTR